MADSSTQMRTSQHNAQGTLRAMLLSFVGGCRRLKEHHHHRTHTLAAVDDDLR
jgi:hypothetical protein